MLRQLAIAIWLLHALSAGMPTRAFGQVDANAEDSESEGAVTEQAVRDLLAPVLLQYCKDACSVIGIRVETAAVTNGVDPDFAPSDGSGESEPQPKVTAELQIDDRVSLTDRDRLAVILRNNLQARAPAVDVLWRPVTLPQIGSSTIVEEQLKRSVQQRVAAAAEQVFGTYCPEQCVLSHVAVVGRLVTASETIGVPAEELVSDLNGSMLRLARVDVEIGMDLSLGEGTRARIKELLKAKTRFVGPLSFDVRVTAFPESYARKREREQAAMNDALGLGRLRETLRLLDGYRGVKEAPPAREPSPSEPKSGPVKAVESQAVVADAKVEHSTMSTWGLFGGVALLLTGLGAALAFRFAAASRDARMMMAAVEPAAVRREAASVVGTSRPSVDEASDSFRQELALKVRNDKLRNELVAAFLDSPRVAKATFTHILQEEGVEQAARYVHVFGRLVVFEMLDDADIQPALAELSEYYQKSKISVSSEEQNRLLLRLKALVTANEIRAMTRKQADKFDVLSPLDASQVHALIADEKLQVQCIVLTQLDRKRRNAVFELFAGAAKVELMRELYRTDAIPKEYLANVASALQRKVKARSEFDAERLRSSDVLLDLLEKSGFDEQRSLLHELMQTDQEAARSLKSKLVTLELIPHLRDAQVLEAILGLDRQDLLTLLAGASEPIRSHILGKIPRELAERWTDDLREAQAQPGDEHGYRLVEAKILDRIRALVDRGAIDLAGLNDRIFGRPADVTTDSLEVVGLGSASVMVA